MKNIITISLLSLLVVTSCKKDTVKINKKTKLSIAEPSGLCFDINSNNLWTVSDDSGDVYKIDPTGKVIETIDFNGDDLEGVAIDPTGDYLYVVEEIIENIGRRIVKIDMTGKVILSKVIDVPNNESDGLEGITINPKNGNVYVVNEKKPGVLIELTADLEEVNRQELNFASDYSGLFFDASTDLNDIWIVSDEDETLFLFNQVAGVKKSIPIRGENIEGIAIKNNQIYAVSDAQEKFYIFNIP